MTHYKKRILLVDDEDTHAEIFTYYALKAIPDLQIIRMRDGQEVVDFLKMDPIPREQLPGLILLDLNLPKYSGHEVLKIIKEHRLAKRIPTVILSSSGREQDIQAAYDNYANSYIRKPEKSGHFDTTIREILSYWQKNVEDISIYKFP